MAASISSFITNFVERDFGQNLVLQKNSAEFTDFVNNLDRKTIDCFASRDTREIMGVYERHIKGNRDSYSMERQGLFTNFNSGNGNNPFNYNDVHRKSSSKISTVASAIGTVSGAFSGGAAMAAIYNNSTARIGLLVLSGITALSSGALVLCRDYSKNTRVEINENFVQFLKDLSKSRIDVEELLLKTHGKYEINTKIDKQRQIDTIRKSFTPHLSEHVANHIINHGGQVPTEMSVKTLIDWDDKSWSVELDGGSVNFTEMDINNLHAISISNKKIITPED